MSNNEKNEFESLDVEESFSEEPSNVTTSADEEEDLISSKPAGIEYDIRQAPQNVKRAPRKNLDGCTVIVTGVHIILPPVNVEWKKTRNGDKSFKTCQFILDYDVDFQSEYYSGTRVFKTPDGKMSHPTLTRDGMNQASALFLKVAEKLNKNINEVSLFELLSFLKSRPKAVIKNCEFKNPDTNLPVYKNIVEKFV